MISIKNFEQKYNTNFFNRIGYHFVDWKYCMVFVISGHMTICTGYGFTTAAR